MILKLRYCFLMLLIWNIISPVNRLFAQNWVQETNFPAGGRQYCTYFTVGGKGYVGFGNNNEVNDMWEYDPTANTWTQKAAVPASGGFAEMIAFVIGDTAYIGMGLNSITGENSNFWGFCPSANTWTPIAAYPGEWTRGPFCFTINGKGYVGSGSVYTGMWEYDPTGGAWIQKNDIPTAVERYFGVGFSIGNYGYAGTGVVGSTAQNDFWQYDPVADSWTQKANVGGGIRVNDISFQTGTNGFIGMGGSNTGTFYTDVWEYDANNDTWSQLTNYPGGGQLAGAAFGIGCTAYIGLGFNTSYVDQSDLWGLPLSSGSLGISNDTTICAGNPVTLTATGGGTTYTWSPGTSLSSTTGATVTASPTSTIVYTVTSSLAGCAESASVTVSVSSGITVGISNDTSICSGNSVTLNATGGSSYSWSPSSGLNATTGASVSAAPDSSTTYRVRVSSGGCSAMDSVAITVNPSVVANVSIDTSVPGPYCPNAPVTFTALPVNGGNPTYQWLVNGGNIGNTNPVFISSSLNNNDVVNCIMTSTAACVSGSPATSNSITVSIIPLPLAGAILANKDSLCAGKALQLIDTGSSGNLQWESSNNGTSFTDISGATSIFYDTSALNQTTYYLVTASGTCGTDTSALLQVFVSPLPVPVITATDTIFCPGDSIQLCGQNSYTTYQWATGGTSQCIFVTEPNEYSLTVTNAYNCSAISSNQNISTYLLPPVSITVHGDTLSSFYAVSSQWLLNDTTIPGANTAIFIAQRSGSYIVEITDSNGCHTQSSPVQVIISGIKALPGSSVFEVYPNPATNTLMIQAADLEPEIISVYDVTGKLVISEKFLVQLDVSALQPGVYFVEVKGHIATMRKKFLKL